jgi:hypothetical protein
MSGLGIWNPDKEERSDMSGLWPDMSGQSLWNLARELDMSGLTGVFGGRVDFDVLHFTNSPNVSPLIVRSS